MYDGNGRPSTQRDKVWRGFRAGEHETDFRLGECNVVDVANDIHIMMIDVDSLAACCRHFIDACLPDRNVSLCTNKRTREAKCPNHSHPITRYWYPRKT